MTRIYTTTFAETGDKETLAPTDPGTGKVSLPSGWTPDYEKLDTDPSYRPVGRKEMNGVINEVTAAVGELQQYGFAPWQALTGGWPLNARVVSGGIVYKSTASANTATPPAAPWAVDQATPLAIKDPVRFTTTANITLSGLGTQAGGDWSGAITSGARILVKNQSAGADNGWYAAEAGAWTRTDDANTAGQLVAGVLCTVSEGVTLGDTLWMLTTDAPITIGTTALTFTKQGGGAALVNIVRYTTAGSGTYTKPSNVTKLRIRCIGGGGGGAGDYGDFGSGGGGGAGGYCEKFITSPSGTYAYVVGAAGASGGTSGGAGGTGGNTTIAGMTASGGGPGYGSVGAGGVGGAASSGDLNVPGDGGASGGVKGGSSGNSGGGKGGSGPWGGGGKGGGNGGGYSGTAGSIGGGGGGAGLGGAAAAGGVGYIEIWEFA